MQTKSLNTVFFIVALALIGCTSNDDDAETSTESVSTGGASSASNTGDGDGDGGDEFFFGGTICINSGGGTFATTGGSTDTTEQTTAGADNTSTDTNTETDANTETGSDIEVDCSAELDRNLPGPGVANTGEGSLSFDENNITLSAATTDYDENDNFNDTVSFVLILHDGETRSSVLSATSEGLNEIVTETRVDYGVYNASTGFMIELNQANAASFTGGSFDIFALGEEPSQITFNYATFSFLLEDKDGNSFISDISEMVPVVSGNINVTGAQPDWSVILDATLEDGRTITGAYNGSFYALPLE